jgi:hypothetical protein
MMENEMDGALGIFGRYESFIKISFENIERNRSLGRKSLLKEVELVSVVCIQNLDQWRTVVYTIMNIRFPLKEGGYLII